MESKDWQASRYKSWTRLGTLQFIRAKKDWTRSKRPLCMRKISHKSTIRRQIWTNLSKLKHQIPTSWCKPRVTYLCRKKIHSTKTKREKIERVVRLIKMLNYLLRKEQRRDHHPALPSRASAPTVGRTAKIKSVCLTPCSATSTGDLLLRTHAAAKIRRVLVIQATDHPVELVVHPLSRLKILLSPPSLCQVKKVTSLRGRNMSLAKMRSCQHRKEDLS